MSQHPSRSSTPSKLYNSHSHSGYPRGLVASSPSRSHIPAPKVLPFPDLPVRTAMSREGSRGPSPFQSPLSSPPHAERLGLLSASGSTTTLASSTPARVTISPSPPTPSPLSPTSSSFVTPRPARARAATHSSASPPRPSAAASSTASSSLLHRQEGFHPAPRPSTPIHNSGASSTTAVTAAATAVTAVTAATMSTGDTSTTTSSAMASPMAPRPVSFSAPSAAPISNSTNPSTPAPPILSVSQTPTAAPTRETPRPILLPPSKKVSNPLPNPTAQSVGVTPAPPPEALVDHLHRSFRTGVCADVRLWVRKWGVGWLVHKMVLVQAGFFHSLFLGDFSHNGPVRYTRKGKERSQDAGGQSGEQDEWAGEEIELTFDDPNITRAAFELCLSRLYSPYPQLHYPASLLPSPAHPLTPSFLPGSPVTDLQTCYHNMPTNAHLVTPRLLLSLLATTTYLGQQYLLREVLAIVLRTVGPSTVGRYLSFAIGHGVGEEEWVGQDDEGAHGIGTVARTLSSGFTAQADSYEWVSESDTELLDGPNRSESPSAPRTSIDDSSDDTEAKVGDVSRTASMRSTSTMRPIGPRSLGQVAEEANASAAGSTSSGIDAGADLPALPHFYGFVSNKLGEACVCWLSRWGLDVLNVEETLAERIPGTSPYYHAVWGQGGIPSSFIGALLSSDALFVSNEIERYRMTRRVLDLRRKGWDAILDAENSESGYGAGPSSGIPESDAAEGWEEDEQELAKVFASGIYYSHMTFDDLSIISSDIDPATALPYAPLTVLQAAHWSAADLRNRITHNTSGEQSTGEIGLTQTSGDIAAIHSRRRVPRRVGSPPSRVASRSNLAFSSLPSQAVIRPASNEDVYHPVPADDTHRLGAGGLQFFNPNGGQSAPLPGIPGMPDLGPDWGEASSKEQHGPYKVAKRPPPQGERTYFGILRGALRGSDIESRWREEGGSFVPLPGVDKGKEERWSRMEPFRFAVEFWDVENLAEKERLYSSTYFYAGSYFNVYVSTIKKNKDKGVQLGIYLHRQNPNEAFPPVSYHPEHGPGHRAMGSLDSNASSIPEMSNSTPVTNVSNHLASTYSLGPGPGSGGTPGTMYRTLSVNPPVLGSPPRRNEALPSEGMIMSESARETAGQYLDPRTVTKAYFSISCASALGTALVRFSSAPDSFALSQSWGWKSSALRTEEYLCLPSHNGSMPAEGQTTLAWTGDVPESGSLRATVVVGVI